MFRFSIVLFCAILVTTGLNGACADSQTSNTIVSKLESAYRVAVLAQDAAYFRKHISPTYIGTDVNGTVVDADTLFREREAGELPYTLYDVFDQRIGVSDNTAVVSECLHLIHKKNGVPPEGILPNHSRLAEHSTGLGRPRLSSIAPFHGGGV